MVKYVFVTGGVVSGLGKGITAASLGRLLKARGYKVTMQKFDPYLNIDPGAMDPIQHGEVYVTDDGAETDLDLGHYERFIDEALDKKSTCTSGKIYWSLLNKQIRGEYGGGTVQVIPHITNEIKSNFYKSQETLKEVDKFRKNVKIADEKEVEIAIIEVGGTVGDIESQPHFETIRQFKTQLGDENCILVHVVLIPYLRASEELKTKPAQMSVKTLQGIGIQPDILVCRSEFPLDQTIKNKLSLFCNLDKSRIIENPNVSILYEIPLVMEEQGLADATLDALQLKKNKPNLIEWEKMVDNFKHPDKEVNIALVGKYTALHDAYLSVLEALKAAAAFYKASVNIKWIDSLEIESKGAKKLLQDVDGILTPGGYGKQGTDGMLEAIKYARENKIPFLGICLGMQLAVIEFARNVLKIKNADSTEFNQNTEEPIIDILQDKKGIEDSLRIGSYTIILDKSSKAYKLYGNSEIEERHRNRYEINNDYLDRLVKNGIMVAGTSPDEKIVEIIELKDHPYFVGVQAHIEYKSRPNNPSPLFKGFVEAILNKNKKKK